MKRRGGLGLPSLHGEEPNWDRARGLVGPGQHSSMPRREKATPSDRKGKPRTPVTGRAGTDDGAHTNADKHKGLKPKQGSLGTSQRGSGLRGARLELPKEGWGQAPRLAGVLTIQSRHDGLA